MKLMGRQSGVVGMVCAGALFSHAHAATIHVSAAACPGPGSGTAGDPYCSIQTAIDNAVNTDVIVVEQGTYFEAIDFLNKAITLRSTDPDDPLVVASTIIDGTGNFHVVQCVNGEGSSTVLSGFTITGGNANGAAFPDNAAGGMINLGSSPTVTNCTFSGNTAATFGGGMGNGPGSNPTVTACTFSGNVAGTTGGGMFNSSGNPTVTGCTFTANSCGTNGAGMYNNLNNPVITDCVFSNNTAVGWGGGMGNNNADSTVTNCTFTGNVTSGGENVAVGGGMANINMSDPDVTGCKFSGNSAWLAGGMYNRFSTTTVTGCTFSDNEADHGGGLINDFSEVMVINCCFIGNTANVAGGGMGTALDSFSTIINCTFSGNTAPVGGGIRTIDELGGHSESLVLNTIAWGNTPDGIADDGLATTTVHYSDVQGGWAGAGSNNMNVDPLFVDTTNDDYHLLPQSLCIDAGDNTAVPVEVVTDQDGNPRFLDDPYVPDAGNGISPIVDMGAYELCVWDCGDHDGNVGIGDFLGLLGQWDQAGTSCDFGLGAAGVGIEEFLDLLANWGPCK